MPTGEEEAQSIEEKDVKEGSHKDHPQGEPLSNRPAKLRRKGDPKGTQEERSREGNR